MKYVYIPIVVVALLGGFFCPQTGIQPPALYAAEKTSETDLTPEQIIKKFSEKESAFYEAWKQYTYTQNASIRVLSVNGIPQRGETMTIVAQVVFRDDGTREVRTISRTDRLRNVIFTKDDQDIIDNLNPFALTVKDIPLYQGERFAGRVPFDAQVWFRLLELLRGSVRKGWPG